MHSAATPQAPRTSVGGQTRALLALGLPLVGSHIAQILISVTDAVMMGWYDVVGLAALSVSGPLFYIVFIFGSGFAFAVAPMVAAAIAGGDEKQTRRVTRMGLWLSIGFGALSLPAFFFAEPLFLALGQTPEVAHEAGRYMPWMGLGMIPALLVQVLKSYLSALELTRAILVAVIGAAAVNAAVNYCLIFGHFGAPELGIVGAGIASLFSHAASLLALTIYARRKRPEHELLRNFHRPDPEALATVLRVGLPIGFTLLAETGLFAASGVMMGWLGTIPLAAHGIALNIASLTFMVPLGLSQAVTVRVGAAWGRRDPEALRAASIAGMALALAAALMTVTAFLVFPEWLIGLFIDPDDPDRPAIVAAGVTFLAMAALFQLVDFGQVMGLGMLRGVQDTRVPMVYAIASYWAVGLPVSYVLGFPLGLGGVGVWLGLSTGLALACLAMQLRFWGRHASFSSGPS
jgi:MATE family multidrug resistance protein